MLEAIVISSKLLEILRCPVCVKNDQGALEYYQENWLICQDCGRKYPIWEDIPVMLIEEGDKWISTEKAALPIPAPKPE